MNLKSPIIMGILNITPDSFYDGGRNTEIDVAVNKVKSMIDEGAEIIDIGASSSRPGADKIDSKEEWRRLQPILKEIRTQFPKTFLSVDTFWSFVADKAINMGVSLINDISAFSIDPELLNVISNSKTPYVLMHMQGNPQNMQEKPKYENVIHSIMKFFVEKLNLLQRRNIDQVIIDPGFGFGKTVSHNYEILTKLDSFKILEKPVLVGLSRKSMIYKPLNLSPTEVLPGSLALNFMALQKGARILRVHDVKESKQIVELNGLIDGVN